MRTEVNRVDVCQLLSVRDIEEWVQPKRKIHRKELKNDCHCVGALEDETVGWTHGHRGARSWYAGV